ncbi:MAG: SIS domain-containing protein [Firmicutes bacterium]|jgi:tagatose-6-phosphate ketose/aldose isomerase|nr:SIS domain-containing protein [Bacillota bacterium]
MQKADGNALQRLARSGSMHTPREIAGQTGFWKDSAERVFSAGALLEALMEGRAPVFAGAGSSDYVGRSVVPCFGRRSGLWATAIPTTTLLTDLPGAVPAGTPCLMVLFSRSGNSPESLAVFEQMRRRPEARFLVVTCNPDGALNRLAAEHGEVVDSIVLHEGTCDKGLAMTASFTNMVVAGQALAHLDRQTDYLSWLAELRKGAERLMQRYSDKLQELAMARFRRAVFLGTGALNGAAWESSLKLRELTDGSIETMAETFLGLRHGPKVMIDEHTLVVYYVSQEPSVARYELDLMAEVQRDGVAMTTVAVAPALSDEARGLVDVTIEYGPQVGADVDADADAGSDAFRVPDALRAPVNVIVGQLLGLFKCLDLGLSPDEPSRRGLIHRVVKGVKVYS